MFSPMSTHNNKTMPLIPVILYGEFYNFQYITKGKIIHKRRGWVLIFMFTFILGS